MITADDLVRREVCHCASSLVSTLAIGGHGVVTYNGINPRNPRLSPIAPIMELCDQASELAAPIDDWEEAAIQVGWRPNPNGSTNWVWKDDLGEIAAESWQDACEQDNLEPYQREVYEHWIVTDWLADKLIEHGEKVDKDFTGMCIWARTTTGQAIAADHVIEAITAEVNAA